MTDSKFKYKLCLKKSSIDKRDLKLQIPQIDKQQPVPEKHEVIIRCKYDQLNIGSCSSNVICNQIMNLVDLSNNEYPSRLFQYYISREVTGQTKEDNGCTFRNAYHQLKNIGFTNNSLWEYDVSKFDMKPSQEAYDNVNKSLVKRYLSLMPSLYAIQYTLSKNILIAFGCTIYDNFNDLDENYIVPYPSVYSQPCGGHALLIISYDNNKKLFKIQNSWGINWGDGNGCCYMHYDHLLNPNTGAFEFWIISSKD